MAPGRLALGAAVLLAGTACGALLVAAATDRPTVTAAGAAAAGPPYEARGRARVLVLGDSFTEGFTGVERAGGGMAEQLADQMGWQLVLDAQGGTGYVARGPADRPDRAAFPERVARLAAEELDVDVVVVLGGLNDLAADVGAVSRAAGETFTGLRRAWPDARLVVTGPVSVRSSAPPALLRVRDAVRAAAEAAGAEFLDPVGAGWTTPELEPLVVHTDGVHPSQAGHDHYAGRWAQALRDLGVPHGDDAAARRSWFPERAVSS